MHTRIKTLLVSLVVIASLGMNATTTRTTHETPLSISEPDALDLYIERLEFAESSGREDIVIIDTNGKKSYGCLQFQEETFARSAKKYHVDSPILDCAAQRFLAREILLHEPHGASNWATSVARIGGPPLDL